MWIASTEGKNFVKIGMGDILQCTVVRLCSMWGIVPRTLTEPIQYVPTQGIWGTTGMIQHISAVTFAVRDMREAVAFYTRLGFALDYGGPQARFSTLRAGDAFVNLLLSPGYTSQWWGRTIFRVDDVEAIYRLAREQGLDPASPQDGSWGERFFHLTDPNGHELSFAQLLRQQR
jgi:catechol 2,3-dioxygenase-like lactoylglutathione lyase family enzyme